MVDLDHARRNLDPLGPFPRDRGIEPLVSRDRGIVSRDRDATLGSILRPARRSRESFAIDATVREGERGANDSPRPAVDGDGAPRGAQSPRALRPSERRAGARSVHVTRRDRAGRSAVRRPSTRGAGDAGGAPRSRGRDALTATRARAASARRAQTCAVETQSRSAMIALVPRVVAQPGALESRLTNDGAE